MQQPIATEITVVGNKTRRWIAIHYVISRKTIFAHPKHLYCVIDTEFDAVLLEKYSLCGDEDLAILKESHFYADGIPQLYDILLTLKIDPELFDAPWNVSHPLIG